MHSILHLHRIIYRLLSNSLNGKMYFLDLFTFYLLPLFVSLLCLWARMDFSDKVIEIFVNSSAIFTGLLLNLLILVYDQKTRLPKVDSKTPDWEKNQSKHTLIKELYFNISYSTLISLFILIFSVIHMCLLDTKPIELNFKFLYVGAFDITTWTTSPVLIFLSLNLVLTILMIIKRIYSLLVNE